MILRLVQLATFIFVTGFTIQVSLDNNTHASGLASSLVGVTAAVGVTLVWETFRAIVNAARHIHLRPRQEDRERVEPYLYPPKDRAFSRLDSINTPELDG